MEMHGFLNVDKPLGFTSHDVIGSLRRVLDTRRVGHAGTLDPAATGVLVVGVGRATRFLDYVQHEAKSYIAHIVFGHESDTADIDGRLVDGPPPVLPPPATHAIEDVLVEFIGDIDQIPPKYSAIKQGGEPVHRKMRRGESVEVPVRQVRVDALSVLEYSYPDLVLSIACGPGVYVRSLARDIGERLGYGAYLHHLVRTSVGGFHLDQAFPPGYLADRSFPESWTLVSTSIDQGIAHLPSVMLSQSDQAAWYHGRSIRTVSRDVAANSFGRAFARHGEFAGIGVVTESNDRDRIVRPRIVLAST